MMRNRIPKKRALDTSTDTVPNDCALPLRSTVSASQSPATVLDLEKKKQQNDNNNKNGEPAAKKARRDPPPLFSSSLLPSAAVTVEASKSKEDDFFDSFEDPEPLAYRPSKGDNKNNKKTEKEAWQVRSIPERELAEQKAELLRRNKEAEEMFNRLAREKEKERERQWEQALNEQYVKKLRECMTKIKPATVLRPTLSAKDLDQQTGMPADRISSDLWRLPVQVVAINYQGQLGALLVHPLEDFTLRFSGLATSSLTPAVLSSNTNDSNKEDNKKEEEMPGLDVTASYMMVLRPYRLEAESEWNWLTFVIKQRTAEDDPQVTLSSADALRQLSIVS